MMGDSMMDAMLATPEPEHGADALTRKRSRKPKGLATITQLRDWHREGTAHYLTYKADAEAEEAAVFGVQWTDAEIAYLAKNGRLDLVFNHIQKNVLAVDGYRSENRLEITYLPKEISDTEEANVYAELAKHYLDACAAEYELDRVKLQQYIGPVGWAYVGHERDDPTAEPFKLEYMPWREMRYDPKGGRLDGLDWRYASRERWFDLEEAQARFPEHKEALAGMAGRGDYCGDEGRTEHDYGGDPYSAQNTTPITYVSDRKEVRIVEMWYRRKMSGHYVKTPTGWEVFDKDSVDHQLGKLLGWEVKPGQVNCVYFATFTDKLILEEGKGDYDHPFFPFVPMWGLRDGKGKPQGAVHAQMDPQKTLNWARSKMLWQAGANRWLYPEGSISDIATWKANAGRPDAMLPYETHPDGSGGKPEMIPHGEDYRIQRDLALDSQDDLNQIGGSPDSMRGQPGAEVSGRAIARKQEGALRQQGLWFREEQRALYQIGVMWRSMMAAKCTDEQILRIQGPNGKTAYAAVNVQDPLRRAELEEQGYKVFGSVTRLNYDTKVVVSPMSATVREKAAAEQSMLNDILSPDQLAAVADIRVLATDIRDKEKIAQRIAELREAQMGPPQMPGMPPGPEAPPPEMGGPLPEELPVEDFDPNGPPEPAPGGFPMDPMMQDPNLMAGEMALDGGGGYG